MTYKLCIRLAALGKLTADMLDVFFAAGRVTADQYNTLMEMVTE